MKKYKRIISGIVAVIAAFSMAMPTFAQAAASSKEEVVYAITDANGAVSSAYVVNIFGSGDITDYGDYTSVKMLTTNDKITQNGDEISFATNADKVYYQGDIDNAELPWKISIQYFIDGNEYTPEDIAGKSGKLEIKFSVTKNENCSGTFYDDYALMANFTLDTDICDNISADGATIANAGRKKQLSYTILQGKGIDASITANVKNFEMDAVSINGVKLNLNLDVMTDELTDEVTELTDAIEKLDDGAKELADGTVELQSGSVELTDGVKSLSDGAASLDDGIKSLQNGIAEIQNGLDKLNSQSENLKNGSAEVKAALARIQGSLNSVSAATEQLTQLVTASKSISTAIDKLYSGTEKLAAQINYSAYKNVFSAQGLDIDTLKSGNEAAIDSLTAQLAELKATLAKISGASGYEQQTAELTAQIAQLENIVKLLSGNNAMISGTEEYFNTASSGVKQLMDGIKALQTEYAKFDKAINQLVNSLGTMTANLSALAGGINTLADKYNELDSGIIAYTDGVAALSDGFSKLCDGTKALAEGSKSLSDGTAELLDGTNELTNGISELSDGASTLSDGTSELRDKTSELDTEVNGKIDDLLSEFESDEKETVSFVSEKNTNVKSVQFVIKTSAIEIPEVAAAEETTVKELSFWQKLLRLFGI